MQDKYDHEKTIQKYFNGYKDDNDNNIDDDDGKVK